MNRKVDLRNLTLKETVELAQELGQPAFRGQQIFSWIQKGASSFDEMANVPKNLRAKLKEIAICQNINIDRVQVSKKDGTRKYLMRLEDGNHIETVFMKYDYGNSICISSQVGCAMGCKFCASTRNGLVRNLTAGEMMGQVYAVMKETKKRISRVVVMGIGEPFENYENLCKFIDIIHSEKSMNMSLRNITVSTCGLVDVMKEFANDYPQVNLAISLHAPSQELRESIMPIAKRVHVDELINAARNHADDTGRRITFEYALMDGINDDEATIGVLADKLKGMMCHVNLIPLNEVYESDYKGSDQERVTRVFDILESKGIQATIRRKLGEDIDAACGQLRLHS